MPDVKLLRATHRDMGFVERFRRPPIRARAGFRLARLVVALIAALRYSAAQSSADA